MERSIVVSDTSPIRVLSHLQLLPLLPQLFEAIFIPPAVKSELEVASVGFRVDEIAGITVRAPSDLRKVAELKQSLDDGEAEAIALALELGAPLLIDERAGRRIAVRLNISVTGVAGILIAAQRLGMIAHVVPYLEPARRDIGFYFSDELLGQIRTIVNE